eukprot:c16244_g1_i1 orf=3-227(-)
MEHYIRVQGLEISRCIFLHDKIPYGFSKYHGEKMHMHCSILVFVHRLGKRPNVFLSDSKPLFERLHIQSLDDLWT